VRGTQKVGSACTSSRTRQSWTEELEIYIRSPDLRHWVGNGVLGLWSTWSAPIERYPRMASVMFRSSMLGSLTPHNRYNMLERVCHMEFEQSLGLKNNSTIPPSMSRRRPAVDPSLPASARAARRKQVFSHPLVLVLHLGLVALFISRRAD
jgi:hypothetical protein